MSDTEQRGIAAMQVQGLTEALASKAPTPGGGGAAGVAASLGLALGEMVANLTRGKRGYEEAQDAIDAFIPRMEALRLRMLELADEDAEAFKPLSEAWKLPRETEEERRLRDQALECALRVAAEPPERLMEVICEAIDMVDELTYIGSKMALSDAGAGAALLSASLRAACLNIFINARAMKDRVFAEELVSRTQAMLQDGCAKADEAYLRVERSIRWSKN